MLVIGFGDSITAARGLPTGLHFLSMLARRLNCETINSGVGGDTSAMALSRMERDVISFGPDVCILQFGMNDHVMVERSTPRVSELEFQANLLHMIDRLKGINCLPVLCTIHPVIPGNAKSYYYRRHPREWYLPLGVQEVIDSYNQVIRETATMSASRLADVAAQWQHYLITGGKLTTALQSLENGTIDDGVHLTEVGYRLYGECLIKIFPNPA